MNSIRQPASTTTTPPATDFWNALAPYHSALEDNYLNRASIRRIAHEIREPILVVGAGQGLIVAELRKQGLECDGVDFSAEMIRYAKIRRGLTLVHADARKLPVGNARYSTVIFATGVIDFLDDEEQILAILNEGKRVVKESGTLFVAFYKISGALQQLLKRVSLLVNHDLLQRESLESYRLSPLQTIAWGARRAGVNRLRAVGLFTRAWALSTMQEKLVILKMQRIFRRMDDPGLFIRTAPEKLPYRNEPEIRNLFRHLAIPINEFREFKSCYIVKVVPP